MSLKRRRAPRHHALLAVLGYLVAAMALAWPFGVATGPAIVAGTEPCGTVPLTMAWTLGVDFDHFAHGLAGYWNAPIFHPVPGTFALSEPMPLVAALAWPWHLVGLPLPVVHTLAVWTHLVLDAWFARRLAGRLGTGPRIATACGFVVESLPFVHQELGVLTLVAVWPALWAVERVLVIVRAPSAKAGLGLGLAVAAAYLCSAQLGVMLGLALVPTGLAAAGRRDLDLRRSLPAAGLAVVVAAAIVGPVAWSQFHVLDPMGFGRSLDSVLHGSMRLGELGQAPFRGPIDLPVVPLAARPDARAFAPGVVELGLAACACAVAVRRRSHRRRVMVLLAFGLAGVLLALGPRAAIGPVSPYDAIAAVVPGYAKIRSPFRAVAWFQLAVAMLAAVGLRHVAGILRRRRVARAPTWVGLVAVLWCLEQLPPRPHLTAWPDEHAAWIGWLQARDVAEPVARIPFAHGTDVCAFEDTARAMVLGLDHGHPLANGYSSYFPPRPARLARWAAQLPDDVAVRALRGAGLRWLVVDGDTPLGRTPEATFAATGLRRAFTDPAAGVTILEIGPPPP